MITNPTYDPLLFQEQETPGFCITVNSENFIPCLTDSEFGTILRFPKNSNNAFYHQLDIGPKNKILITANSHISISKSAQYTQLEFIVDNSKNCLRYYVHQKTYEFTSLEVVTTNIFKYRTTSNSEGYILCLPQGTELAISV